MKYSQAHYSVFLALHCTSFHMRHRVIYTISQHNSMVRAVSSCRLFCFVSSIAEYHNSFVFFRVFPVDLLLMHLCVYSDSRRICFLVTLQTFIHRSSISLD
jgi:hypothetical protein